MSDPTPGVTDDAAHRAEIRRLAGRIGGLTRASRYGSEELTGPARRAFLKKFETQVDPDGVLDPQERARRAQCARLAHMARLAQRSAAVRRRRTQLAQAEAELAEVEDEEAAEN